MIVKFSFALPFWIYGENKIASKTYLNQWLDLNGIDFNNSFKVNEMSKDNIIIISKNPGVKYVVMEINNQNFYYYQTNVAFIANNTYQINLSLDWYATYGLIAINQLSGKNVFVKRSHHALQDPFKSCVIEDEKLNNIVPLNTNLNFVEDDLISINREGKTFYKIDGIDTGYDLSTYRFGNIYAIWKREGVDSGHGYYIMPISTQASITSLDMYMYNDFSKTKFIFNNCITKIRHINNDPNWMNSFIGIFTGPNFMKWKTYVKKIGTLSNTLFFDSFNISYFEEYTIPKLLFNFSGNEPLRLNFINGLYSPYILNFYDFKIGNTKLDCLNFEIKNNKFKIKDGFVGFNESSFVFYNNLTLENFNDTVKTYSGSLISESRPYLEYIAQNKNRLNTSLAMGGISMLGSMVSSIATGNPLMMGGALMGGRSIINTVANLKDKKRELLDKPNASYDNDNAFYGLFNLLKNIKSTSLIYYRDLENLAAFNNQIVYYGWKQNKYLPFNIEGLNKHFYIQLDANEVYNKYSYCFEHIPKIYLDQFLELLNNGLRLWKSKDVQYEE